VNIYLLIFAAYIVFLLILGYVAARRSKETVEDYFVAGRSLNMWIVAGTYGASFMSAGSFIGQIGMNYRLGWATGWQLVGTLVAVFFVAAFLAKKFWRFGFHNGACSMPDLIGMRYSPKVGRTIYALIIFCIYTVGMASMYMGMNAVVGLVSDVPYMVTIIIAAVAVAIYTISGGARAVAWTDTACMVLMMFAIVAGTAVALVKSGGLANLIEMYGQSPMQEGAEVTMAAGKDLISGTNSYFTVGMCVAWGLIWATGNPAQPHQLTRVYLARDEKHAILAVAIVMIPFAFIYIGGLIIANYARVLDPFLEHTDQAFPLVVMDAFPAFIAAIILVGIIAAVLSTASTMLIITGQTISYDIHKKVINPNATEKQTMIVSRVAIAISMILSVIIAYIAQDLPGLLFLWSAAFAMMGSGILPSLIGAFYWKGATAAGSISSMLVGFITTGAMYLIPTLKPAWIVHPILFGLPISIIVYVVVSWFTKKPSQEQLEIFYGRQIKDDPVIE
jgi:SSS family transporter